MAVKTTDTQLPGPDYAPHTDSAGGRTEETGAKWPGVSRGWLHGGVTSNASTIIGLPGVNVH